MSRTFRIGVLVIVGSLLLMLALFAVGNRTFLFSQTVPVRTSFSRVAGLQAGASVQYQGVRVGRVESVSLPRAPGEAIEVLMAISEEASHLIRTNTQAQIKSDGLVGEQIIVLVSPRAGGEPIEPDHSIRGIDPFDLFEITDRALASVREFESAAQEFRGIMSDVRDGRGTLGRIVYDSTLYVEVVETFSETRRVMTSLATSTEANSEILVGLAARATEGIESILRKVDEGDGSMARILNDPALYEAMLASADTLRQIATDMRAVTSVAENAATWGALGSYRFAELMEAAKHNWLFKRYFEERGHMEQAPFEIRERAISESWRDIQERQRDLQTWEERLRAREASLGRAGETSAAPQAIAAPDSTAIMGEAASPDSTAIMGEAIAAPDSTAIMGEAIAAPDSTAIMGEAAPAPAASPDSTAQGG